VRKPFPDNIPRERVVIEAPAQCPCCSSSRLSMLGEDVTETVEVIPRQWKVIETVREKFSCRDCEAITQPPAPFAPAWPLWNDHCCLLGRVSGEVSAPSSSGH
jgi:transposase